MENLKKNDAASEEIAQLEELIQQFSSLDAIENILKPILEHFTKLSTISEENQTPQQKLWLLAYANVESKYSGGTETSMLDGMRLMPILYETIDY